MEWIDRGLCVGDDPTRWDVENLPEGREDEAAADLCAACPVMVACAKDALRMVDNSHAYNRVVAQWNDLNAEEPGFTPREEEPSFASYQEGVVRAGVAMIDTTCVEKLSAICGERKPVEMLCEGCGRALWRPGTPPEQRPEGSVKYHCRGKCWRCGHRPRKSPRAEVPIESVAELHNAGLSNSIIAMTFGVHKSTIASRMSAARKAGLVP